MALHTKIPIYRAGLDLLALAHRVQEQMPRGAKRTVGEKIAQHCIDILELMALATALQRIEDMPATDTYAAGNSYLGLVRQASHSHKERAALCRALLKRGHPVEGKDLTQVFRKMRNAT